MKVLMFGWEFPPHISGGLGTACYGLTKGLSNMGTEVLFVMPSASGDEDERSPVLSGSISQTPEENLNVITGLFRMTRIFLQIPLSQ
jgi:glycogen synthase